MDDEWTHGLTRFYGGKTLVRALAERGWPVGEASTGEPGRPPRAG